MAAARTARETLAIMRSWGVPGYLLRYAPFDPRDSIGRFSVYEGRQAPVTFSEEKQREMLDAWVASPLRKGSVFVISSENDDLLAKQAVVSLLAGTAAGTGAGVLACSWQVVYGGLRRDGFLDEATDDSGLLPKPKMVVLSNVSMQSTAHKKEKLADILEAASDLSAVVATTGADPISFMRSIGRHATGCLWLPRVKTRHMLG